LKKYLIPIVKYGLSIALLVYLCKSAMADNSFDALTQQEKNWPLLLAALLVAFAALSITFIRWFVLVRSLDMPFRLRDAFRLGFLGYLMNFFTLGVVGGDLLKAVFLAREQPERKTEAAASVVIDRAIGLYALFVVGAVGIAMLPEAQFSSVDEAARASLVLLRTVTYVVTVVGAVGIAVLSIPGVITASFWNLFTRIPKLGSLIREGLNALETYRQRKLALLISLLLSFGVHCLFSVAVFCTATALAGPDPSLGAHFMVTPVSMLANALPLPGGLGAFEYALTTMYTITSPAIDGQQGFVVALAFRVITMLLATIGLGYYLFGRRQVSELIASAQSELPKPATEAN